MFFSVLHVNKHMLPASLTISVLQATSALDNASERIVQQALDRLAKVKR